MQGVAYVFLNRNGANGLGHVGAAFLLANGQMMCFATENIVGHMCTPAAYKSCWIEDCNNDFNSIISVFQKPRSVTVPTGVDGIAAGTYSNADKPHLYTDWKMFNLEGAKPDQAAFKLLQVQALNYNLIDRNCENDVYDVLHNEYGGYGITADDDGENIYMGWVTSLDTNIGPTAWFDNHIRASDSGTL